MRTVLNFLRDNSWCKAILNWFFKFIKLQNNIYNILRSYQISFLSLLRKHDTMQGLDKHFLEVWLSDMLSTTLLLCLCRLNCFRLSVTLWTIAHQAPLSRRFSRQESWKAFPCLFPQDLSWPRDRARISYFSCINRQVLYH